MFSLKATTLLALPLLAAASTQTVSSRAQRRHELLELLQHNHSKRAETYGGPQPICTAKPGTNEANFTPIDNSLVGRALAGELTTYTYTITDAKCANVGMCQNACIVDAASCIAISYDSTGALPICKLYGKGYSGATISTVPLNFQQMTDAGTTSGSSGGQGAMTVPTCAIKGNGLDTLLSNPDRVGQCKCGEGRTSDTPFTCKTAGIPVGSYPANQPAVVLDKPVEIKTKITWDYPVESVPAVMTASQCASVCASDTSCQAYLLVPGTELSTCWKIGLDGVYASPAGFPITASMTRKRQAAGVSGSIGGPGDIYQKAAGSAIVDDLPPPNAGPSQGSRKRSKRASFTQW